MECVLEANPSPDITWFQGTKTISDNSRVRMIRMMTGKDTYLLTLEISNPTREDGGNYRCNAFNNYGESNANISLNFQGMMRRFLIVSSCVSSSCASPSSHTLSHFLSLLMFEICCSQSVWCQESVHPDLPTLYSTCTVFAWAWPWCCWACPCMPSRLSICRWRWRRRLPTVLYRKTQNYSKRKWYPYHYEMQMQGQT